MRGLLALGARTVPGTAEISELPGWISDACQTRTILTKLSTPSFKPQRVSFTISYQPVEFAKLLAKIAFAFVVAQHGLTCIRQAYVLGSILNKKDDIGMCVGCNADGKVHSTATEDLDIRLSFLNTPKRDIIVESKLLGRLETPTYLVVVGEPTVEILAGVQFDRIASPRLPPVETEIEDAPMHPIHVDV